MRVNQRTKELFCVLSRACQFFDYVRSAARGAKEYGRIGRDAGDVNPVRASIPPLKEASAKWWRVVKVVRIGDVG
jgi:hypothetical protein